MTEGPGRQADEMFCRSCGSAIKRDVRFCPKCGVAVATIPEAEYIPAAQPDMLQDEVARRTGQGWVLVSRDAAEAQMRKPKRFSILWFLAWTILSFGALFWVYLIWHWAKSDQLIFLRVVEGQIVVTGGGRGGDGALFAPFAAYWRWAGQRESTQGKVIAYGAPVVAVIVLIIIISVASATGGGGDDAGEQVAGQPTQAAPVNTGAQEPADQETAEPTQPPEPSPVPSPTEGPPPLSAAECAYSSSIAELMFDAADSLGGTSELLTLVAEDITLIFNDAWISQLAVGLTEIRIVHQDAVQLQPPASMADIHERFTSATGKFDRATDLIAQGVDNLDAEPLDEATALMVSGTADLNEATQLIEELASMRSVTDCG